MHNTLKKLPALLLALLMMLAIANTALAENDGTHLTATGTAAPQTSDQTYGTTNGNYNSVNYSGTAGPFNIDSGYKGDGMTASYADGYVPTVNAKDKTVSIVLPLQVNISDLQPDRDINTSIVLTGAPFVSKNITDSIKYANVQQGSFQLKFNVQLQDNYQSGTYTVPITVKYTTNTGMAAQQVFSVNVLIPDAPKPTVSPGASSEPSLPPVSTDDAFSIDTTYYNGAIMNASYSQGYSPVVVGDIVEIVVPLKVDTAAIETGSNLRTSIALDGSPFVAKNYQNEWTPIDYQSGFLLIQYDIQLSPTRENGTYPVPINITYKSDTGEIKTQTFTVNVIITNAPEPTPSPTSTPAPGDAFAIDPDYFDANIMKSSYSQGYTPTVAKNAADIVLPLSIDYSAIKVGTPIRTTVTLTGKPFVARNYENKVNYTDLKGDVLIVRYYVGLETPRENGAYAVPIEVSYTSPDGEAKKQTFNVNVIITDGTASASQGPQQQPKVIMSNYTIDPDPAYAGQVFKVTCTLKNTNSEQSVKNMTVTYTGETTDLMPESGANTTYISSISPGGTEQFSFSMEARADAKAGPQKILLGVSYEDAAAQRFETSDTVVVQIKQEIRLTNDDAKVPEVAYAGESIQTTLNLYNKGKNTLYNVTVNLEVPGLTQEQSAFLGNMDSGASKTAEIYAMVDGGEGGGQVSGSFLVSYEDEYGDSYELDVPVELEIMEAQAPMPMPETDIPTEPENPSGIAAWPWWVWLIIGGGALVTVIAVVRNRRKKRREQRLMKDIGDDDFS